MMKLTKWRFFQDGPFVMIEEIEYLLAGVFGPEYIPLDDPRVISIGELGTDPNTEETRDAWVVLSVLNPGFDGMLMCPTLQSINVRKLDTGTRKLVDTVEYTAVESYPALSNPYDYPLKPGLVEITEAEYNTIIDAQSEFL